MGKRHSNLMIKNCYSDIEKKDIESSFKRLDLYIFVIQNLKT